MPARKRVKVKPPNISNRTNQVTKTTKKANDENNLKDDFFKTICVLIRVCFYVCCSLITSIVLAGYFNSPINPTQIKDLKKIDLEGQYAVNDLFTLKHSIHLDGPECIVEDENMNIYTGLNNGDVMKIYPSESGTIGGGKQELLFHSEFKDAAKTLPDAKHGRPLGMRIIKDMLYVIDAVYGMYTINLNTKVAELVIKIDEVEPNLSFPDDLDITSDGEIIYFTDATSKYNLNNFLLSALEGSCTGRLFEYTIKTNQFRLMKDGMCFCNGVQLNSHENSLAVAETLARRAVFVDTETFEISKTVYLPAHPDNIRMNREGNFLIATNAPPNKINDFFQSQTWLARVLAGILPYDSIASSIDGRHSIIVEVSQEGKLVQVFHDSEGHVIQGAAHCSQLSDGRFAIGSFFDGKMSIVDVKK